jgi:hypothetical protein
MDIAGHSLLDTDTDTDAAPRTGASLPWFSTLDLHLASSTGRGQFFTGHCPTAILEPIRNRPTTT